MGFSENVKKIKSEKGMTAEQLSKLSGVPLGTLTKILSGATEEPKLGIAERVAEALGCSVDFLISGKTSANGMLNDEETAVINGYRMLDERGKSFVSLVIDKEIERVKDERDARSIDVSEKNTEDMITLPLFLLPVSAGTGAILDNSDSENIQVRSSYTTRSADYALRVSGNSMEPTFRNGDVLLVQKQTQVEKGELGIFVGDGEGYFKRFMGKYLHSLNPSYEDIPLSRFTEFFCCGKVIGNLKRKGV